MKMEASSTKTAMTCPSEEEWAEMDRLAERYERISKRIRIAAFGVVAAMLMFLLTLFVARHSTPMHQDPFALECGKVLQQLKGN